MSDWIGVYSTAESIKAGLDLEMPYVLVFNKTVKNLIISRGPSVMRGAALERSIIAEKVFPSDIDIRVRKVSRRNDDRRTGNNHIDRFLNCSNMPISPEYHLMDRRNLLTRLSFEKRCAQLRQMLSSF